ncbi:MAG: hypothetical protein HN576_11795 [Bacteriovoracaceae bacterium]|jgi:hypothetical protein|nr:hypothetical protein [Bacteriovoracaceae bacterium]
MADKKEILKEVCEFNKESHGSSTYDQDSIYIVGQNQNEFAPLNFIKKKVEGLTHVGELLSTGFVSESLDLFENSNFSKWFELQFSKKLTRKKVKTITILNEPDNKVIFEAISNVNTAYQTLREMQILLNGKNLPIQLGEWYAKCIFGLLQKKSTSQRGFDFLLDNKRVEVKINWADTSSPKGIKLRKSLVELSDYCIIIYIAKNFMIREICFLDSAFVVRKFAGKGHTLFLKDVDLNPYFFSKSAKHVEKVANSTSLLKYATPNLAMKIAEYFS